MASAIHSSRSLGMKRWYPPERRRAFDRRRPGEPVCWMPGLRGHVVPVSAQDLAAARQLADEVAASTGSRRTWRKVTTMLELFGVYRLTGAVRERIAQALDEAGLIADPPFREVERYGTIRLALRDHAGSASPEGPEDTATSEQIIGVTAWRPGAAPEALAATAPPPTGAVLWIDVDVTRVNASRELFAAVS